jgi:hypothetical protein
MTDTSERKIKVGDVVQLVRPAKVDLVSEVHGVRINGEFIMPAHYLEPIPTPPSETEAADIIAQAVRIANGDGKPMPASRYGEIAVNALAAAGFKIVKE